MMDSTLTPNLLAMLEEGRRDALREFVDETHPAEVVDLLLPLEDEQIWRILHAIPQQKSAEIFSHFELDRQIELTGDANRKAMARMLEQLPHDDRADLVRNLEPQVAEQILPLVARADREDIRKLTSYPEETAGGLMSSDYATLGPDMSIADALQRLRQQAPTRETIYYIYVVDQHHRLIGFVSLKDLILANPSQPVHAIMHEDVILAEVAEDQESVTRKIEKYDLLAIPVVDPQGKLVGIITHDDALDVIRQEQQEDVEKLMAITGLHESGSYLRTPSHVHFKNRIGWVLSLAVVGLLSGTIIQRYEDTLSQLLILALFMPMLADTGGNTGSQAATVVVRALALGEVKTRDLFRVLFKEFKVAIMLCGILGMTSFARVMLLSRSDQVPSGLTLQAVGLTIAVALSLQVVSATLLGALLPMLAARFKLDPALVASPALTTAVDITGLLIYFNTAKLMLGV